MKLKHLFIGLISLLSVSSCIQDEALNVEAAIDDCTGANIQCLMEPIFPNKN